MIEQFARLSVQGRCFPITTSFCFFNKLDERLSLIYGANGSGKSTISRAFNVLSSPVDSDISVTAADISGNPLLFPTIPPIAVFNEDYIDANVKIDDDGLGSIVLLGEHVELETQIVAAQQAIDYAAQELAAADSALSPFIQRSNVSSPEYHWESIKNILKGTSQWAKTDSEIKGNRQNSAVTDAVVQEICSLAVTETLEELRTEFDKKQQLLERTASSNSAYTSPIQQISIDPHLEDKLISLLARKIDEPVLTEREKLILQMVQDGHQSQIEEAQRYFSNNEATFCPYCFQQVTEEYKANLLNSILMVFNKDVDEHKTQLAGIKLVDLSDAYGQYAELDEQLTQAISQLILEYNQILERYRAALKAKAESVYTPITQTKIGLCEKVVEINEKLIVLEQKRAEFIAAVRKRKTIESDLLQINKKIASLFCRDSYAAYKKQLKAKQVLLDSKGQKDLALKQAQAHMQLLLAQKKNLALVEVYTDKGISGTNTKKREGFNRMVKDALDGKIDLILTKSVSRFARNTVDTLTTIRKLKERGVAVYFEEQSINTMDDVPPHDLKVCGFPRPLSGFRPGASGPSSGGLIWKLCQSTSSKSSSSLQSSSRSFQPMPP